MKKGDMTIGTIGKVVLLLVALSIIIYMIYSYTQRASKATTCETGCVAIGAACDAGKEPGYMTCDYTEGGKKKVGRCCVPIQE